MAMDLIALKAAKKYVDDTLTGAGALKGDKGDPGAAGKSSYDIAVDNGFIGTETEWLESLKATDGKDGVTPNLTIGTVETLEAGSDATATITGDKENPVLNLGIPKGVDGSGDSKESTNLLAGINWCAIGDSFTWGDPANDKFTDRNGKEWYLTAITWLANEIEANLTQVGLGGAHFMPKIVDGEIDTAAANYIMNPNWWYGIKNLQSNTQLITIQIGLNDNGHTNFPIGSYGDETLLTSYGAFKILMDKIKETCPFAKIGLIVSDAFLRTEYANFLYDLSKKYNLPILDLSSSTVGTIYGTSAGDSYNYNFASAEVKTANNEKYRISSTNGHPNTESHKLRAEKMRLFINSCVGNDVAADSDGYTPNLTIGTVETLPSGSDATASITGDKENPVLNLGIPKGADGQGGSAYYYKPVVIATTAGKYWKKDGTLGDSTEETDTYIKKVSATNLEQYLPVSEGEVYRVTLGSIGAIPISFNATQCVFLDDNNTFVANAFENTKYKDHVLVTVPTGATKMHFTVWSGGGFSLEKQTTEPYGIINKFEHMNKLNKIQQESQTFGRKTFAPFDKGYITFVNDDLRSGVSEIVDVFVNKGIPLCLAAPYGSMNNLSITGTVLDSAKRAVENGGEVLSHAANPITETEIDDFDAMYNQFATHKEMLELYGFEVNGIILAGGNGQIVGSQKTDKWARAYYQYSDLYGNSEYGYPYYHYRTALSGYTLDTAKAKIDEAISNKEWVVFYLHEWSEFSKSDMEVLLDYINSKDVRELGIMTYKQMYDNFCISCPKYVVSIVAKKRVTVYEKNSTISTDDIVVTAYYNDGTIEEVTSGVVVGLTEVDTSAIGNYYANVTYSGKTYYIPITIYSNGDRVVLHSGTADSKNYLTWELYSDGVMELTNTATWKISLPDYTDGEQPWYDYMDTITKVKVNTGNYSIGDIGSYAFYGATNLTEISGTGTKIKGNAFGKCGSETLKIADAYSIGMDAFADSPVTEISVSASEIPYGAFRGVNNLTTVKITNSPSTMDANAFQSNRVTLKDIYVPWAEGSELSANAPWGATGATIHYDWNPDGK